MTYMLLCTLMLLTPAGEKQSLPFNAEGWQFKAKTHRIEQHLGRESLYLERGIAWIPDANFKNGILEFDLAITGERGFVGGLWRAQDADNREEFYIRPHQSGNPDANQYTPVFHGLSGWQLYHGPEYGKAHTYPVNQWFHVRIVVSGQQAEVYVGKPGAEPTLFIPELKRELAAGGVGIMAGGLFAGGWFSNVSWTHQKEPVLKGKAPAPRKPPAGMIASWSVSPTFPEKNLIGKARLSAVETGKSSWTPLASEAWGVANLGRVQGVSREANTALVKVVIESETARTVSIRFGYSDRAHVYLNDRLLYAGDRNYRSRDYRYLGTIGLFDTLYLPLEKGKNELVFAVSESFGGWGIIAAIEDRQGLTLKP